NTAVTKQPKVRLHGAVDRRFQRALSKQCCQRRRTIRSEAMDMLSEKSFNLRRQAAVRIHDCSQPVYVRNLLQQYFVKRGINALSIQHRMNQISQPGFQVRSLGKCRAHAFNDTAAVLLNQRSDERIAVREILIKRADTDTGTLCDAARGGAL